MHDVSIDLAQNEVVGVLGPSGAGKSTLFKMITMAQSRSAGSIMMAGKDFNDPETPDSLTRGQI